MNASEASVLRAVCFALVFQYLLLSLSLSHYICTYTMLVYWEALLEKMYNRNQVLRSDIAVTFFAEIFRARTVQG